MDASRPIVITKKKGGHGGYHGGAWKVAYADFVTAMMKNQIELKVTTEGLRIELLESATGTFFDLGNSTPNENGRKLLDLLAGELGKIPNKISIEGHGFQTLSRQTKLRELGALYRSREFGAPG